MVSLNQQERLARELSLECKTFSQAWAAAEILVSLWDRSTAIAKRNELLFALIAGYQQRQDEAWCYAVLHMAMAPYLCSIAKHPDYQSYRREDIRSAFARAVKKYPSHQTNFVALTLGRRTVSELLKEEHQDKIQRELEKKLEDLSAVHTLVEILTGATDTRLTKAEAKQVLGSWVRAGWLPAPMAGFALRYCFPKRLPRTDQERQAQHRAIEKIRELLVGVLSQLNERRALENEP